MDWTGFFDAQAGRPVRSVLVQALQARDGLPPGMALDLGCGEGTETRYLLANGWRVHAFDSEPGAGERVCVGLDAEQLSRLRFTQARFEDLSDLPAADLVYAGFALPFCTSAAFPALWAGIRSALKPGAIVTGELFGPHDEWADRQNMNFHDRVEVEALLDGLTVHSLIEDDRVGQSAFGPKHWHVFHLTAQRPG